MSKSLEFQVFQVNVGSFIAVVNFGGRWSVLGSVGFHCIFLISDCLKIKRW